MNPENFQNPVAEANAPIAPTPTPQKSKGPTIIAAVCAILALGGIAFGVYGMMESNSKSQQISNLETRIENKDTTIAELETTISNLKSGAESEDETVIVTPGTDDNNETSEVTPGTESKEKTITLILGDKMADSETSETFEIGSCTADGGTSETSHIYIKCHVTTAEGESLVSWHDDDNKLRFTVYNSKQ